MSYTSLSEVLSETRARLQDAPELGLVVDDRILMDSKARRMAHKGIVVSIPKSSNTGDYRDQDLARVEDTLAVTLAYRIRPQEIQASISEAMDLEEQVRIWLVSPTWKPEWHVTYDSTTRSLRTEWWISEQTFTLTRDALLGG